MPFTVSHAVVALALRRVRLPVAAVAVGSMAPDAVLFAPFLPDYTDAHSWWGVLTIDLAVSLVVLAVWWFLVRPAWAPVVPGVRRRLPPDWSTAPGTGVRTGARGVLAVVGACVLGSATHVFWDGFTHAHGFAVLALPALRDTVVAGRPLPFLLQDLSSVVGLGILLLAVVVWWVRTPPRRVSPLRRAEVAVLVTVVAGVVVVTAAESALVVLHGGGVGTVLVASAFRVPVTVALALVVGAVALLVERRGVLARSTLSRIQRRRDGVR